MLDLVGHCQSGMIVPPMIRPPAVSTTGFVAALVAADIRE
jgi:hypothetical protein